MCTRPRPAHQGKGSLLERHSSHTSCTHGTNTEKRSHCHEHSSWVCQGCSLFELISKLAASMFPCLSPYSVRHNTDLESCCHSEEPRPHLLLKEGSALWVFAGQTALPVSLHGGECSLRRWWAWMPNWQVDLYWELHGKWRVFGMTLAFRSADCSSNGVSSPHQLKGWLEPKADPSLLPAGFRTAT